MRFTGIFRKAGVSKEKLKDGLTKEFVYDFLERHGLIRRRNKEI